MNALPGRSVPGRCDDGRFGRLGRVLIALLLAALWSVGGVAAVQSSSVATAVATVEPQIAVAAVAPVQDLVATAPGTYETTMGFQVEANIQAVTMYVEATDLYFQSFGAADAVPPIPLEEDSGVTFEVAGLSPADGGETRRPFVDGDGSPIEGVASRRSQAITFASDSPLFAGTVFLTLAWNHREEVKPAGRYIGKVRLTCMAAP